MREAQPALIICGLLFDDAACDGRARPFVSKMNLHVFTEPGRVVVANGFRVAEGLHDRGGV
jgi:hypothetical protein